MSELAAVQTKVSNLPVSDLEILLTQSGLEETWYRILKTHVEATDSKDFGLILSYGPLKDADPLDHDMLDGLSFGQISILYEFSLAFMDPESREEEGQYFTPDDVSNFLAEQSVSFGPGTWLDPCSGIGNLIARVIERQPDPEKFLKERVILVDQDPLAILIARVLLVFNFQDRDLDLFDRLADRFICRDFLDSRPLPEFDFAILNPPYVSGVRNSSFETNSAGDLYAFFLEKVSKLSKGFISITPQSFTHATKFRCLRTVLLREMKSISIYSFDNVPGNIFEGLKFGSTNSNRANSTRPSIMVASRVKSGNADHDYLVTPLIRWRSAERPLLFSALDQALTSVPFSADLFPKVQPDLSDFYLERLQAGRRLGTHLSRLPTNFVLSVATTPRYFISAASREMTRASVRKLYFHSEKDWRYFYLLLNSSYLYWWWRVVDGGMSLSQKTILTLPVGELEEVPDELVALVARSESDNRVTKLNSGMQAENVKHPPEVVQSLNEYFFPEHRKPLFRCHQNSDIPSFTVSPQPLREMSRAP